MAHSGIDPFTQRMLTRAEARTASLLPRFLAPWAMFFIKHAWAALFGIVFCIALVVTDAIWRPEWVISRYDALFIFAVSAQALLLLFRLETWEEARVILLFHITGTVMEIFKTSVGSWSYPGEAIVAIGNVPLFSGFMYASIGSYIARAIRIFDLRFAPYPPFWVSAGFATLAYLNFFSHHYLPDIRVPLFVASVLIFIRTRVWFRVGARMRWMPMPLAALIYAFVVWIAENIGTATETWVYTGEHPLQMVRFAKMGSWYLLLFVAFATVTLVTRNALSREPMEADDFEPPR